jgi:hypothetical protein
MSPPNQQQQLSDYDNNNGYRYRQYFVDDDDEMPELESEDTVGFVESTYQVDDRRNHIVGGSMESLYLSFWRNNNEVNWADRYNAIDDYNPNPADENDEDQDQEECNDSMPELINDQNMVFSDSFMENVEVNDNVLDFGYNFDFLVEMN